MKSAKEPPSTNAAETDDEAKAVGSTPRLRKRVWMRILPSTTLSYGNDFAVLLFFIFKFFYLFIFFIAFHFISFVY